MTTERRFTGYVTRCETMRRAWWRVLLGFACKLLVLLLLAAVIVALFAAFEWCVKQALGGVAGSFVPQGQGCLLAVAPVMSDQGWTVCVWFLTLVFCVAWVGLAKAKQAENEKSASLVRAACPDPAKAGTTIPGEDPLGVPYHGLDAADVGRILDAAIEELGSMEEWVKQSEEGLSVEDYGDRLRGVRQGLKGVKLCLNDLRNRFVKPVSDTAKQGGSES